MKPIDFRDIAPLADYNSLSQKTKKRIFNVTQSHIRALERG